MFPDSILYVAVAYNSPEALHLLLSSGANPNTIGGKYLTPLISACRYKRGSMIEKLLDYGARVDIYGGPLDSALHAVCYQLDSVDITKRLIDDGADVNRVSRVKHRSENTITLETPLYVSAMFKALMS